MVVGSNLIFDLNYLLSNINQLKVWSNLTGYSIPTLQGKFTNPFRKDNSPDCYLHLGSSGDLILVDFANKEKGGSIYTILKREFDLTHIQILEYLKDFIGKVEYPELVNKSSEIQVSKIEFNTSDLRYWASYGVTKEILNKVEVYKINNYSINSKLFKSSYCYGYTFMSGRHKIYLPYNRSNKFLGNSNDSDIYFYELLKDFQDTIHIVSGLKDALSLYSLGYESIIAFNSEKIIPKEEVLRNIINKTNNIIIIYDKDDTGLKYSSILEERINQIKNISINQTSLLTYKDVSIEIKHNGNFFKRR